MVLVLSLRVVRGGPFLGHHTTLGYSRLHQATLGCTTTPDFTKPHQTLQVLVGGGGEDGEGGGAAAAPGQEQEGGQGDHQVTDAGTIEKKLLPKKNK